MLTGLLTRRHFFEIAAQEQARARRSLQTVSVFVADLDRFKQINDTYGHAAGDDALKVARAACAAACARSTSPGGWAVRSWWRLLPDTSLEDAAAVAERFRTMLEQTEIRHEEQRFQMTVSVGIASWTGPEGRDHPRDRPRRHGALSGEAQTAAMPSPSLQGGGGLSISPADCRRRQALKCSMNAASPAEGNLCRG
ncbi:MAG: GGDEF domain-containing protein [Aliidongia sp.]